MCGESKPINMRRIMLTLTLLLIITLIAVGFSDAQDFQARPDDPDDTIFSRVLTVVYRLLNDTAGTGGQDNPQDLEFQNFTSVLFNDPFIISAIKSHGVLDIQNSRGMSILIAAAHKGASIIVEALLKAGAFIDLQDNDGKTGLMRATDGNYSDIVKTFIEYRADVNVRDRIGGDSALNVASGNGYKIIVQDLLAAGASINLSDFDGDTPLLLAAFHGHTDVVKLLVDRGALLNHQNKEGYTALIIASRLGNLEMIRLLLKEKVELDRQTIHGDSALVWAAYANHLEALKELVVAGVDIDSQGNRGKTALMYSLRFNNLEMAKFLLAAGANIDIKEIDGDTALMEAVNRNLKDMVVLLLQHCPDHHALNNNRKSVFDIAVQRNRHDIKAIVDAHTGMTCVHDSQIFLLGQKRYESCHQVQCCHGLWSSTGVIRETCGRKCTRTGTPLGYCVEAEHCSALYTQFLEANALNDITQIKNFLRHYSCGRDQNVKVCCPVS